MPPPWHGWALSVNHFPPGDTHMPCPKATTCSRRCLVHTVLIRGRNIVTSRMCGHRVWEEVFVPLGLEVFYTFC